MKIVSSGDFSIVVVCTGNISRSRYAAALLQARSEEALPGRVEVSSAGIEAREGSPVESCTAMSLRRHGIAVPATQSRRLRARMLLESDLVLGATAEHIRYAMTMTPSILHHTFTLTGLAAILDGMPDTWVQEGRTPPGALRGIVRQAARHRNLGIGSADIPDPNGHDASVHTVMETMVDGAVARIADGLFAAARRP